MSKWRVRIDHYADAGDEGLWEAARHDVTIREDDELEDALRTILYSCGDEFRGGVEWWLVKALEERFPSEYDPCRDEMEGLNIALKRYVKARMDFLADRAEEQ